MHLKSTDSYFENSLTNDWKRCPDPCSRHDHSLVHLCQVRITNELHYFSLRLHHAKIFYNTSYCRFVRPWASSEGPTAFVGQLKTIYEDRAGSMNIYPYFKSFEESAAPELLQALVGLTAQSRNLVLT